jgi:hypothetical protein
MLLPLHIAFTKSELIFVINVKTFYKVFFIRSKLHSPHLGDLNVHAIKFDFFYLFKHNKVKKNLLEEIWILTIKFMTPF